MKTRTRRVGPGPLWLALTLTTLSAAAHAQSAPEISATLRSLLGTLPIEGIKDELQVMAAALRNTPCGGKLRGCYGVQSGRLQLYFFTGLAKNPGQQTLLLVVDQSMPLPKLLGPQVQRVLGDSSVSAPILSISTTDYELDYAAMPPALQGVVERSYFKAQTLSFSSGVQLAARADLGGAFKQTMEAFGVKGHQLTIRAAVVMPIPTDLAGAAGAGAGAAAALAQAETMKKAGADALMPSAFVEFQFAPGTEIKMGLPQITLTDATFFLDNSLLFGYRGNAYYSGVPNKPVILSFMTPLPPSNTLDYADFSFRMATPPNFTMEDAAKVMVSMASPDPRLAPYGGGLIRGIASFKNALLAAARPLSVFQLRNPNAPPPYKFANSAFPFPRNDRDFNIALVSPLAEGGPWMSLGGETVVLGQTMGRLEAHAGVDGLHAVAASNVHLKLGPLGPVSFGMRATIDIDGRQQNIGLSGNFQGQPVNVVISADSLRIDVPATCANPFRIDTTVQLRASTNLAQVFDGEGGVTVDPAGITGCIGEELMAAYNKVANVYRGASGYTAAAASQEIKRVEREAKKAAKAYEDTKNAARDTANKANNVANQAMKAADNVIKGFGKKKRHKPEPDPKFASSVFDWDYYYDTQQDVVKQGQDLATHWHETGFKQGLRGSLEFDHRFYRARYTDVQALCTSRDLDCTLQHWLDVGLPAGRQGSADFSVHSYIGAQRHRDLNELYGLGDYIGAMEHWLASGADEGRNGRPDAVSTTAFVGPVRTGGGGGGAWSDDAVCKGQHVIGWRVFSGSKLDLLQFQYPGGWGAAHGGNKSPHTEHTLAAGEYVVGVDYRSGGEVDAISFRTNRGRTYGPYGGGGGSPGSYDVTPGQKLGCMQGRSGARTDQLT